MPNENNQEKQNKQKSSKSEKITINESSKSSSSGEKIDVERLRIGNAGDTENTGPRKR